MSLTTIKAESLGKQYRIGQFQRYDALRDSLGAVVASPMRLLRRDGSGNGAPRREPFWALRDVSFEIESGEIVGLIGRNGAGKSTLLKVLARITEPTAGQATLRGRVGSLLEVATGFHAELTGRENIYLNGAILGMRRAEIKRKFDDIVEFAGTGRFLDTPMKRYSSGMEVRLGFSVAAHLETEILLVDEVLAVGDVEFQRKCMGKMRDVTQQGRTVLFVSHNLTAIRGLCPRTILLKAGSLEADGDTDSVLATYLSETSGGRSAVAEGDELDRLVETDLSPEHPLPLFRLLRLAILDQAGIPRNSFGSDEPFELVLDYRVTEPLVDIEIAFQIVNEERDVILQTEVADWADSGLTRRVEPGVYRSRCTIPPNLFGERRLYVSGGMWSTEQSSTFESTLDFEITFQGYNGQYARWSRQGYFRPELRWDVERIGESAS